jgi:hypothetical protein
VNSLILPAALSSLSSPSTTVALLVLLAPLTLSISLSRTRSYDIFHFFLPLTQSLSLCSLTHIAAATHTHK